MTYVDIQNAVLKNAFSEGRRSEVKQWIQFRHAWLWDLEQWTFKFATSAVVFAASSQIVGAVPADFRTALALYDANGNPISGIRDMRTFFDSYNANLQNGIGIPEAFTVVGSQIMVGPAGDGSAGLLVYEKSKPALVNDGDLTGLPDGYDVALVHGAKAEGFKLSNIPLWQGFDDDFTAAANALRRNYLIAMRGQAGQLGAFRPGAVPARQWR
jgi:hypothetical protein